MYEPMHHFHILGAAVDVLPALARQRAVPLSTEDATLDGIIPAANVYELQQLLPSLTRGEGVLESAFDHYEEVRGVVPERPLDHNPLNRKEYLLRVRRRVAAS